ncbi:hypothetical protein [Robertmurraya kyonggiensis]|uniref:Uncharacterized protein n=1 Tax=Robertmurraya kyonggiensis TaxID=1037680 RepID=A0A4U1CZU8_9BACI|nr:hypothetical protein [Robertmurraya kyonggiensis]TKC14933.1 hypothetical protein FA727_20730 [Robertmurraya kyonggiensis]
MNIHFVVAVIAYFILLVLTYGAIILKDRDDEEGEEIIVLAFNKAYVILAFGLLVVYSLFLLPHITLDYQTTSYLILVSKFIPYVPLESVYMF